MLVLATSCLIMLNPLKAATPPSGFSPFHDSSVAKLTVAPCEKPPRKIRLVSASGNLEASD